ncbi:hypothetical protein PR048_009082 [Dryococelus australis]|uniref:Uncharacterized protein n=1 Tax=Dryococelus australis TaxID=614101 RepID=A0ABQ9HZA8_9NEOP|nr:hypothetical protein PR048_009082 [Dryococelus australis]
MALQFSYPNRHYITSKHPQFKASRKKLRIFEEDLKSDLKFFKSCSKIKNKFDSADFKQHG